MSVEQPEDVPPQWHAHFEKKGIEPTFRALERHVPVSLNTIIRALTGEGRATERVVSAISGALGMTPEQFHTLRGVPVSEPFKLPARASRLTKPQRKAVMGVIDAILGAQHQSQFQSASSDDTKGDGWGLGLDPGGDWGEDGNEGQDVG